MGAAGPLYFRLSLVWLIGLVILTSGLASYG